jgi:hypothetical protein
MKVEEKDLKKQGFSRIPHFNSKMFLGTCLKKESFGDGESTHTLINETWINKKKPSILGGMKFPFTGKHLHCLYKGDTDYKTIKKENVHPLAIFTNKEEAMKAIRELIKPKSVETTEE